MNPFPPVPQTLWPIQPAAIERIFISSAAAPVVGKPFANAFFMILAILRMKVHSEKRRELTQTMTSLSAAIRLEEGCQYCVFYQSVMSGNQLFLLEEWNDEESLQNHLQSDHFRVLRGAMILLKEPYKLTFHTEFHPRDWRRDDEELMDQRPQAGGKGR